MEREKCKPCNGYGNTIKPADDPALCRSLRLDVRPERKVDCSACGGSGYAPCPECNGYGTADGKPAGEMVGSRWIPRDVAVCVCGGDGIALKVAA